MPGLEGVADDAPFAERSRGFLEQSLRRLQSDSFDFYHLWFVNNDWAWEKANEPGGPLEAILQWKKKGLVRHVGITTHAKPEDAVRYLDSGHFDIVTVSFSLIDRAAAPIIEEAAKRGIAVVVMNPLAGGLLTEGGENLIEAFRGKASSLAELALKYVVSCPGVTSAIAGFGSIEELEADAAALAGGKLLSDDERKAVEAMAEEIRTGLDVPCTGCGYCLPCPEKLGIDRIFRTYQLWKGFGVERARAQFRRAYNRKGGDYDVDKCTECGECVERCSQGMDVPALLRHVRDTMTADP